MQCSTTFSLHGVSTKVVFCAAQKNIFGNLAWPHATVQLEFKRESGAPVKTVTVKAKGSETETLPLFTNKDGVRGEVRSAALSLSSSLLVQGCFRQLHGPAPRSTACCPQVKVANVPGKKVEHQGIKVQLLGQIELASERGHPHDFVSLGALLPDICGR